MPKKKLIIAGNWKMHKKRSEVVSFLNTLKEQIQNPVVDILIAPSFTLISEAAVVVQNTSFLIGAQNMHEADQGAFTGEVSAEMLQEAGAHFVILGHSERRRLFHETETSLALKVKKAFSKNLLPILCIGETAKEKEDKNIFKILEQQLTTLLQNSSPHKMILAYEPFWAIGSGEIAPPKRIEEIHQFCRKCLASIWGYDYAHATPIIYGGSVTPESVAALSEQANINGVLVGKASLEVSSFIKIINLFSIL